MMNESKDSPIVRDVRRVREQIAKECGYDIGRLFRMLRRRERASARKATQPRRALRRG